MSTAPASLVNRHTDATQKLILSTAIELLESAGVSDLTVRAVARHAGMSERTVFRYYASRDEFLDAVAAQAALSLQPPAPPEALEDLPGYPRPLYERFEEKSALVRAALHTDIYERMRERAAADRWRIVQILIDARAPRRSERDRAIASANIRYYLAATTWRYYRFHLGLDLDLTIDCAEKAVRLTVEDILS